MDISKTLKEIVNKLDSMCQTVDSQHAEICQINRKVQARSKDIRTLKKKNATLRNRLSRYEKPPKDSNNSGIPPSKENIKTEAIRRTKYLSEKSDRPVGGQRGHEGHSRKMVDAPDEVIENFSHYCQQCGSDIYAVKGSLEYTTQEIDIPLIVPIIREYRHFAKNM